MTRSSVILPLAALLAASGPASDGPPRPPAEKTAGPTTSAKPIPAEQIRFSTGVFRAALKKRGLTDLLELHLRDFPPADSVEKLLMTREVKLAEFADTERPVEERRTAIAEANVILERLIERHRDDPRRLDWQFELAHSLLYDEAEPFSSSILYYGGNRSDREDLADNARRAVEVVNELLASLEREYARVDKLPIAPFESLERTGYIDKLDRLAPRARYLRLWALFYDALWRKEADPTRATHLNEIVNTLEQRPHLIETAHAQSRVRVQGLLLAGMVHRMLNHHAEARDFLNRAIHVSDRVAKPEETRRIEWAARLARIERIRNDRDEGHYDEALAAIERLRHWMEVNQADAFELRLAVALLERSIHRQAAAAAEEANRAAEATAHRERAWKPLAALIKSKPDERNRVYAGVYALIRTGPDTAELDPFEQCALLASLLAEVGDDPAPEPSLLERAIRIGERFLAETAADAPSLVPEVLYNLGAAYYRRGLPEQAARHFLRVAREHPHFARAKDAATAAVRLASQLHTDEGSPRRTQFQQLYRSALEVLLEQWPDSADASYWRFFYAQLLDDLGALDEAARQFARVEAAHEYFLESMFLRVRALARRLHHIADQTPEDTVALRRRANELFAVHNDFFVLASNALGETSDTEDAERLRELLARARLSVAEVQVLPALDRPAQALDTLSGIESQLASAEALAGRVWRVRLLAYERLGRLDDAAKAIPQYTAADPKHAGPTVQSLYKAITADVGALEAKGDAEAAQRKAEVALILAEELYDWARRYQTAAGDRDRRILLAQLGEAHIHAGGNETALTLLAPLLPEETAKLSDAADVRILHSYAEALFQLERFDEALPRFNRLALSLPPEDVLRWQSLLRDLQCRTALSEPPQDVIKVIDQQRHLFPELGGPRIAAEFDQLYRENQRRLDGNEQSR